VTKTNRVEALAERVKPVQYGRIERPDHRKSFQPCRFRQILHADEVEDAFPNANSPTGQPQVSAVVDRPEHVTVEKFMVGGKAADPGSRWRAAMQIYTVNRHVAIVVHQPVEDRLGNCG
jgi:hypothetical protein